MLPEPIVERRFCSQCGQPWSLEDLARFGEQLICASCKDAFVQKLREGVSVSATRQYGGFWRRSVAALVDGSILLAVSISMQEMLTPVVAERDATFQLVIGLVLSFVNLLIGAAYESILIHRYAATPGKMAMGLEVVRADGSAVSLGRAIGRHFAKMISGMVLGIGYLMVAFDAQKRGMHDMMCETRVLKAR